MLDVNGVVEIAGGFAVDGDDGEVAKIFAALVFCFGDGNGAAGGFLQDCGGKCVREVMLADDDFDVDAEVAGAAEDFYDASGWRGAAARVAGELDVDYGAVEFGKDWEALGASPLGDLFGRVNLIFRAIAGVNSSPGGISISLWMRMS